VAWRACALARLRRALWFPLRYIRRLEFVSCQQQARFPSGTTTRNCQWAALEVITDYAIGKFLKVTEGQAHLITSGLMFGRKGCLLADLVAKSDDPQKSAILGAFNKLRGMSKRDMFAHSYLRSTKDTITFLDRSVSGEFSAKEHTVTLDDFRAYVMDFETAIGAFRASLGATREQLDAFAKAALSLSRNSKTSSGKPKESS
jgi:hypothetical protein